ncbi:porin family protein [Nostoc sp.]
MRLNNWKNLFFCIFLASSGGSWCCIRVDAAESANTDIWRPQNLASTQLNYQQLCQKLEQEVINSLCKQASESHPLDSQMPLNLAQQTREITQAPGTTEKPEDTQKQDGPPQLESQPSNLPTSPPDSKEQLLNAPEINYSQRLERLIQLLRSPKLPPESYSDHELGLRVRLLPLEQQPLPPTAVVKFKPIGSLQARVGYFQTNNIFSSNDSPIEDGFVISGLTLASAYFPLGSKTYLNGSIDGNLIRYLNQSQYHYNQVRFNLSIYQQLSQRMYGEISWSNQQLFYANNSDRLDSFKAGDRFLNENSLELSLGRRDPLTPKLTLDSFYELSLNFADPLSRNRIINSFWVSLNYYLQKPLQVGIDYQANFSDFTQRDREDQFHRLFGHLNYQISDTTNMNVQAGVSLGSSTDENIDFDGWFFSINYNLQLGQF